MSPFRGGELGDVLEAPVREGTLRLEVAPKHISLKLGATQVTLGEKFLTIVASGRREKRESLRVTGSLWVARDVPHDDLGLWLSVDGDRVRRVFGAEPQPLFEKGGLAALAALDRLSTRLRQAVVTMLGAMPRALELGRGLDKVLILDHGDRYEMFQRPLFRDGARRALEVHRDGRVTLVDGTTRREVKVRSRFGVTVIGDYLRFADPSGLDLAKLSIPWINREDRDELARRIGELVDARSSR